MAAKESWAKFNKDNPKMYVRFRDFEIGWNAAMKSIEGVRERAPNSSSDAITPTCPNCIATGCPHRGTNPRVCYKMEPA